MQVNPRGGRIKRRKTLGQEPTHDAGQNIARASGGQATITGRIDPNLSLGIGDDGITSF